MYTPDRYPDRSLSLWLLPATRLLVTSGERISKWDWVSLPLLPPHSSASHINYFVCRKGRWMEGHKVIQSAHSQSVPLPASNNPSAPPRLCTLTFPLGLTTPNHSLLPQTHWEDFLVALDCLAGQSLQVCLCMRLRHPSPPLLIVLTGHFLDICIPINNQDPICGVTSP